MATSLKALCDKVLGASGFLIPASYFSSISQDDVQMAYLANECTDDIREKMPQIIRKTFTQVLTSETSYPLPSDFLGYVPDTGYTDGRIDPILLPVSAQQWNEWQASNNPGGIQVRARFLAGELQIIEPQASSTIRLEYYSNSPWTDSTGTTPKEQATDDTDLCLLDRRVIELGIKWRWKKEKGLQDWQVDQSAFVAQLNAWRGRDQGARTLYSADPMYPSPQPYTNLWVSP